MSAKLTAERYRLRAEEVRAIAAEIKREEYRRFLLAIADDYDRMGESAQFMGECRARLDVVTEHLDRPMEAAAPHANGRDAGAPADDDPIQACRVMAEDAGRLGAFAEGASRDAWLQLSERWAVLANRLESKE